MISSTQERTSQGSNTTGAPPRSSSIAAKQGLAGPHDGIRSHHCLSVSHAAGLSTASAALMVPLRNLLLWKTLTAEGESQAARPLQHGLQRERDGKCHGMGNAALTASIHLNPAPKGLTEMISFPHWFCSHVKCPSEQICQFPAITGTLTKLTVPWLRLCG